MQMGRTLLHTAVAENLTEVAMQLIKQGANLEAKTEVSERNYFLLQWYLKIILFT